MAEIFITLPPFVDHYIKYSQATSLYLLRPDAVIFLDY
jgi:hypothetical protein